MTVVLFLLVKNNHAYWYCGNILKVGVVIFFSLSSQAQRGGFSVGYWEIVSSYLLAMTTVV